MSFSPRLPRACRPGAGRPSARRTDHTVPPQSGRASRPPGRERPAGNAPARLFLVAAAGASPSGTGAGSVEAAAAVSGAPISASSCSAVGAAITCRTSASGSTASEDPSGSSRSPACTAVPTSMSSTLTSMPVGMCVASASIAICTICWSSRPPENTSPVTWIGMSTVTFSPRRTRIRSTCSTEPRIGLRCTAFGRTSWFPPGRPSRRISTFAVFSAIITSWPGSVRCRVSVPWPYSTAGTRPARRSRRAAPLPNSVRGSAAMLTSGTVLTPYEAD